MSSTSNVAVTSSRRSIKDVEHLKPKILKRASHGNEEHSDLESIIFVYIGPESANLMQLNPFEGGKNVTEVVVDVSLQPRELLEHKMLGLVMPNYFYEYLCEGATVANVKDIFNYRKKFVCNTARPEKGKGLAIDMDLVLGYDVNHIVFQHDVLTGIPQAALSLDFVLASTATRGVICSSSVQQVFESVLPKSSVFIREKLPDEVKEKKKKSMFTHFL